MNKRQPYPHKTSILKVLVIKLHEIAVRSNTVRRNGGPQVRYKIEEKMCVSTTGDGNLSPQVPSSGWFQLHVSRSQS